MASNVRRSVVFLIFSMILFLTFASHTANYKLILLRVVNFVDLLSLRDRLFVPLQLDGTPEHVILVLSVAVVIASFFRNVNITFPSAVSFFVKNLTYMASVVTSVGNYGKSAFSLKKSTLVTIFLKSPRNVHSYGF